MATDCSLCVVESLDRADELVAVRGIGRVEVEGTRMAQIPLGNETGENNELMPRPSPTSQSRERPRRCDMRSEEHTSELQSQSNLVCRLLLEKKKNKKTKTLIRIQKNYYNKHRKITITP